MMDFLVGVSSEGEMYDYITREDGFEINNVLSDQLYTRVNE